MGATGIYAFVIANPHESITWADEATELGLPVGVLSLAADLVIFVIPFAAIMPLQISHAKRLGALLIFLTGGRYVQRPLWRVISTDKGVSALSSVPFSTSITDISSSTAQIHCGMAFLGAYLRTFLCLIIPEKIAYTRLLGCAKYS